MFIIFWTFLVFHGMVWGRAWKTSTSRGKHLGYLHAELKIRAVKTGRTTGGILA